MQPLVTYIAETLGARLGKGAEGEVFDIGGGKVKKVFHRGSVPLTYQLLLAATASGDIQALPQVYEVGDDYIIRENCTPNTPKCRRYWKVANKIPEKPDPRRTWQLVRDGETPKIAGGDRDVLNWLLRLQYELSQVCGPTAGLGDFAEKNLGETFDGRVVLMDF